MVAEVANFGMIRDTNYGGIMDKKFGLILGVVVVGLIAIAALTGGGSSGGKVTFEGNPREIQPSDYTQPSYASVDEIPADEVVIIEYADFQCPGCAALWPVMDALKQDPDVAFTYVFRHFPLVNIHPNSMAAHRAAEAAGRQGNFFGMHDLLFQRQQQWSSATNAVAIFESYAEELGLNVEQFKTDAASQDVFDSISSDQDSGNQLNLTGTPTLLLNGEQIATPRTLDELKQQLLDAGAGVETTATQSE
jgi:protein-disulfide isomerase